MVRELVCENQRRATPFSDFSQEALQTATGMGDKGGVPFSDERMERKYAACLPPPPAPPRPSPRTSPLWPRRYTGLSGVWLPAGWVWLDEALFCDGFGGAPFLAGCPPKSAMRMDSNRFADECRALTESWIESTWFFTLVVAVTCAVVGFGTMKLIRKQEKAKSGPGRTESDVTDLRSSFGGRKSNQVNPVAGAEIR